MAPKHADPEKKGPGREYGWVGLELVKALTAAPEATEPLVRLVQEHAGAGRAGGLINALIDVGIEVRPKPKKEMTDDAKAALVARLQKGKRKKQAHKNDGEPEAESLQDLM